MEGIPVPPPLLPAVSGGAFRAPFPRWRRASHLGGRRGGFGRTRRRGCTANERATAAAIDARQLCCAWLTPIRAICAPRSAAPPLGGPRVRDLLLTRYLPRTPFRPPTAATSASFAANGSTV